MECALRRLLDYLLPPPEWRMPVALAFGALVGLLLTVAQVSRATSYLFDSPDVCVNCHVMTSEYVRWHHSAHRGRATCNDCHLRHENLLTKLLSKADSGLRHMAVYTLQAEPIAIRTIRRSHTTIQDNCVRCHASLVHTLPIVEGGTRGCIDCHRDTPHGRISSLVSAPNALVPMVGQRTARWMLDTGRNDEGL